MRKVGSLTLFMLPNPPPPPLYPVPVWNICSVFSCDVLSFRLDIGQDPGKGNVNVITAQQFYMCLQFVTEKPHSVECQQYQ